MTRIVAISDDHHKRYYIDLPEGDILIHGGDFTYRGEPIERMLVIDWLNHISKKYKHVVIIMGNHDINMTRDWFVQYECLEKVAKNVHLLQDTGIELEGVNFYGSPYSVRFGDWGFGEPEEKLIKRFSHIPKKTDVLITHGPPYSILDKNKNGECCGSKALYERIKKLPNLKCHIFGHIHEGYGKKTIENVDFYNVSVLNEHYQLLNLPTVIDL